MTDDFIHSQLQQLLDNVGGEQMQTRQRWFYEFSSRTMTIDLLFVF